MVLRIGGGSLRIFRWLDIVVGAPRPLRDPLHDPLALETIAHLRRKYTIPPLSHGIHITMNSDSTYKYLTSL